MDSKIIQNLLSIANQIKYFHWQTTSFAKHKALDKAYGELTELMDDFVEILIGKYGRDFLQTIELKIFSKKEISMYSALNEIVQYLTGLDASLNVDADSDLLNIRDEMLGVINKTKYLFTLK